MLFGGRNFLLQHFLGAQPPLLEAAIPYWNIRVLGYPLTLTAMALVGVLRGLQQIKVVMVAVFTMTVINGLGSYLSVFHWDFGLQGVAFSTVLSFLVCNLILIISLLKKSKEVGLFKRSNESLQAVFHFGKDAFHLTVRTAFLSLAFFILVLFATRLGSDILAAHQIMLQLWLLASFTMDGFAVTANSIGAKLIGQKRFSDHFILCKRLLVLGCSMGFCLSFCYMIAQTPILYFFSKDMNLHAKLKDLWFFLILTQPMNGILYVLDGVLFGCRQFSDLRNAVFYGFCFVFTPLLVFSYFVDLQFTYLWYCLFSLNMFRLLFGLLVFQKNKRD